MSNIGRASELSAVNELLAAIGEDPVEDLENLPPSGNTALFILQGTSRDLQEEGHWFNMETDYTLSPDPDSGFIDIPDDVLEIRGSDGNYMQKGDRLYDRDEKTYVFSDGAACEVILHVMWEDLPAAARRYITALATERFIDGFPGAQAVTEARARNLMRAKVAFERAVIRHGGLNLLNNTTIQQLNRRS